MADEKPSLLAGRNTAPLSEEQIRRAINTFLGLDRNVNVRYLPASQTVFRVSVDADGHEYGEIVFGPDLYPGPNIIDPNSALSLEAAAAHELTHYYRWKDMAALPDDAFHHLDEALTSLQAICRYDRELNGTDKRQLVADAMQRLQLFVAEQKKPATESNVADSAGAAQELTGSVSAWKGLGM